MKTFHWSLLVVLLASVALPLAIWRHGQHQLDGWNVTVRERAVELAQLAAANEQLSKDAARAGTSGTLSEPERLELLSLRSEVGRLRQQTNLIERLRARALAAQGAVEATTPSVSPPVSTNAAEVLVEQATAALQSLVVGLQPALQRYAAEHTNQSPVGLLDLRDYYPRSDKPMPGFYFFDFVGDAGPLGAPADALVLRARQERRMSDGKWMRLYAFGDGRIVQAISEDGDFEAWENQQKIWPPATNRVGSVRQSP